MRPRRHSPNSLRRLLPFLGALTLLAAACSLEVNDLPENHPPSVSDIFMDPPPAALAPRDSFRLSVSATDLDDDLLRFAWSSGSVGSWAGNVNNDSTVTWVAPSSFAAVDTVEFSVLVRDAEDATPVVRTLDVPVIERTGSLRVDIVDLEGNPAAVPVAVLDVDTLATPASTQLFDAVAWGEKVVVSFATDAFHGARSLEPVFAGYPDTLFIQPDVENRLTITVAPTRVLLLPGVHADSLITELQAGVDYCAAMGVDTLLLAQDSYSLAHQELPGVGSAALRLDAADLLLAPMPDVGPVALDAGEGDNDFGLYLSGRSQAMRIRGLAITGAASTGIYLYHSSATVEDSRVTRCGSAGVFLDGRPQDALAIARCVLDGNDHGVSLSGGALDAERLLILRSHWYGLWLRDGAAGTLTTSSVLDSDLAGAFLSDAGAVTLERCIVARGGRGLFLQSGAAPTLVCNLLWDNPVGDYGGLDPGASDLLADPLFCDPDVDDWRVDAASPALGGACGDIGALGDCDSAMDLPVEGF